MRLALAASGLLGLAAFAASADLIPPQPQLRGGAAEREANAPAPIDFARQDADDVVPPDDTDAPEERFPPANERKLPVGSMIGPLACNAGIIDTDECVDSAVSFRSLVNATLASDSTDPVVVPCGTCAIVDYTDGSKVTLPHGLDVVGRLVFPTAAHVTLNTTSVVVQGRLDMAEPEGEREVRISLHGTEDQYYYPHDECGGAYGPEACDDHRVNMDSKPIVVAGGKVDIRGRDEACPSWTRLSSKVSNTLLRVDPAFASCLKAGEKLLIASAEKESDGDSVHGIASVDATAGKVVLSDPVARSLPALDGPGEPEFAVEVASLTRKIVFVAQDDNPQEAVGGHFIVFHTEGVEQVVTGVKFANFGQGGILGRYPIHFHLSSDSPSLVSKNVVANSNQRCVVIHSTNGVTVDDNVAYDTKGHCYVTEAGNEVNNVFKNNLGARTKLLWLNNGQSDSKDGFSRHVAATYWVRNMMNEFYGNVAAGGNVGWWLEMGNKFGDQKDTGAVPSFRDNVAHSYFQDGLMTYRQGWFPPNGGVWDNIRIYKIRGASGMKFHNTGPLVIRNSLLADNALSVRYGAHNRGVTFENTKMIGLSKDKSLRTGATCPWPNGASTGVYASFNNWPNGLGASVKFQNVTFERFWCNSRTIKPYYDSRMSGGMGDPIQASAAITGSSANEKTRPYFDCAATARNASWKTSAAGSAQSPRIPIRDSSSATPRT